jgi:hypothetical protein
VDREGLQHEATLFWQEKTQVMEAVMKDLLAAPRSRSRPRNGKALAAQISYAAGILGRKLKSALE